MYNSENVSDGDRLSFLGALLGAAAGSGLAIAGAVYIEDRRREQEAMLNRRLVRDALLDLRSDLGVAASEAPEIDATDPNALDLHRSLILDLLGEINDGIVLLESAAASTKLSDFGSIRAIHGVRKKLERMTPIFERETRIVSENRVSGEILRIYHANTRPAASALLRVLDKALEVLDR